MKRCSAGRRRAPLVTTLVLVTAVLAAPDGRGEDLSSERVREAVDRIYIHGVTEDLARETVGSAGLPHLLQLLADPEYGRRDNVVAFLGYLGDDDATRRLLDFLEAPPRSAAIPEEDRALLLVPVALGQIAANGYPQAMDALLRMTAADGGDDLFDMALRGLAHAGGPFARRRLEDLQERDVRSAGVALDLFDELHGTSGNQIPRPSEPLPTLEPEAELDTNLRVHDSPLDYANHVSLIDPISDARADQVLAGASLVAGRTVWGPIGLQGLVLLGLYVSGAAAALIVAAIFKRTLVRGDGLPFAMELPTYRWPTFRVWATQVYESAWAFLRRAGTIILAASVLLWVLLNYPKVEVPPNLDATDASAYAPRTKRRRATRTCHRARHRSPRFRLEDRRGADCEPRGAGDPGRDPRADLRNGRRRDGLAPGGAAIGRPPGDGATRVHSRHGRRPQSAPAMTRSRPTTSANWQMRWATSSGCSM